MTYDNQRVMNLPVKVYDCKKKGGGNFVRTDNFGCVGHKSAKFLRVL